VVSFDAQFTVQYYTRHQNDLYVCIAFLQCILMCFCYNKTTST